MIKIIYNPPYDGEIFLGNQPNLMGTKYLGTTGLLQELGLRLGIPTQVKSDVERQADYHNAMQKHISGTTFEKAAQVDPFGVASKMLRWRDDLLMAGWDGKVMGSRLAKLSVLADIETDFSSKGTADLWRVVCEACKNTSLADSINEIEVDCPWSEIPTLVKRTLERLKENGVQLILNVPKTQTPAQLDITKIKLLEFTDVNEAYEWLAQVEQLPENTVVVNRDNMRLNYTLYTWDKPAVHASVTQSNPQLLQLFKLSMSVFARPININNLVSFLQLPMSPIPGALRYELARVLLRNGGFGEKKERDDGQNRDDWEETIASFEFVNKDGKVTPQAKAKKMPFLNVIREPYTNGIPKEDLVNYIAQLQEWIRGFNAADDIPEERIKQLHQLSTMFSSFSTVTQSLPDLIQYEDIEKRLLQIYYPMDYVLQQTELDSLNVIEDIRCMAIPANTLIWLDCQAEDSEIDPYDFLNSDERNYLSNHGTTVPDFGQRLKTLRNERIRLLNDVKGQVVLVKSAYDGTTRLSEHSMVAEANHANGTKLSITDPKSLFTMRTTKTKEGNIDHYQSQLAYELGPLTYPGRKESNTSIDTLIQLPFNYVMQYVAKLPMPQDEQIKNAYVTKGLVAHYFFQHIIEDGNQDFAKMRDLTQKEFDIRLEDAINATGLILLQPENTSELHNFKNDLKESMLSLITIMENLNLKPVGCEMPFPAKDDEVLPLTDIGSFGARIDFLLTNSQGDYVIFDFKWSNSNRFAEMIQENTAVQLELYKQTVLAFYPGKNVVGVGYYLMPLKQLITADFNEIPGSTLIKHIERAGGDLFEKIRNAYRYRMEEIRKGHIEEAELMNLLGVTSCYYADQQPQNLCPLDVEEKTQGGGDARAVVSAIKSSESVFRPSTKPNFDYKNKEASETATSHPILKGRLK